MSYICAEDTRHALAVGTIVTDADATKLSSQRHLTLMRLDAALYDTCGIGGFCKREFGAGVLLRQQSPSPVVKLGLYIAAELPRIHWRARIKTQPGDEERAIAMGGSLRLAVDTSQGVPTCGLSPVDGRMSSSFQFNALPDPEDEGGWVIGGQARVNTQMSGVFGFSLYGNGNGFRVVWAALSQSD